jgi:hypothetical protein
VNSITFNEFTLQSNSGKYQISSRIRTVLPPLNAVRKNLSPNIRLFDAPEQTENPGKLLGGGGGPEHLWGIFGVCGGQREGKD